MRLSNRGVRKSHRHFRGLVLVCVFILQFSTAHATGPWWQEEWHYRVHVTVDAAGFARYNKAAETAVNFTQLLTTLGASGALDENSLRVIETDAAGIILDTSVPFQFDKDADYNASSKASGTMVILLTGTTGSAATRFFDIYFALTGGSFPPPTFPQIVGIVENASDMGQAAYRIDGPGSSMYYQTQAGAFSSWLDANFNDWIDWNFVGGAGGTYRGIPNAIYPESKFHPGALDATSSVVSKGPLKITVKTVTGDGKWEARWEFYSRYATMTMVKADHSYWFLYEGVPGGALVGSQDFMYRSNGTRTPLSQSWNSDIGGGEWAYFSDPPTRRSLFVAHHTDDALLDSYFNYSDSMTVFGFGRDNNSLVPLMSTAPDRFTIGLLNDTTYALCRDSINSAYKPLTVSVGEAETEAALPIQLAGMNARAAGEGAVVISWRTFSETNNYGFEVQRAHREPEEFKTIQGSFVPGAGTTLDPREYSFTVFESAADVVYYRLRQIDLDGTAWYSDA
ncbi:MAG: hypothetical protein IT282_04890, partial [Bacteroidetes bacterium]|nr:hypothetical protein [Bacteroidota bacterium]